MCCTMRSGDRRGSRETYGRDKEAFLRTFLALPNGIPWHTFTRHKVKTFVFVVHKCGGSQAALSKAETVIF